MQRVARWLQHSVYRVILLALVSVSVVPIVITSVLFIRSSSEALVQQMEVNLQQLVSSKAAEISLRLDEVMHTTIVAARQAEAALSEPVATIDVAQRLQRYDRDHRDILGLDVYYNAAGGAEALGDGLSNVYWMDGLRATDPVATQIIQTESLDAMFGGIKSISPDTKWIYMTTAEGMMRLYPWASNDNYPDNWDPREIIFYTVAEPSVNPSLEPRWTAPYVDYAGAGWMVTASVPMLNADGDFLGIMSHDITIESLKQIALSINVLDGVGYGFLIDDQAQVIAHPAFQEADASKGTQEETTLLEYGAADFTGLVENMVAGGNGFGYYEGEYGSSLLVFAPIPETGWSLGISIPRENVIAPAIQMRQRAIVISAALVGVAIAVAVVISRRIHQPVVKLLQGVQQVSREQRADEIQVKTFDELRQLAAAFNDMAARIWERETTLRNTVAQLRIEIDQKERQKRVESIVETDYFKQLEMNASRLRDRIKNGDAGEPALVNGGPP